VLLQHDLTNWSQFHIYEYVKIIKYLANILTKIVASGALRGSVDVIYLISLLIGIYVKSIILYCS
jgi:hypothetical protein